MQVFAGALLLWGAALAIGTPLTLQASRTNAQSPGPAPAVEARASSPGATFAVSAATPRRFLDLMTSPVPYPWIMGTKWPPETLVRVTVHWHSQHNQFTLHTRHDGSFGISVAGVRWCTGLVIDAVDATNYRVVLHGVNVFHPCPPVTEAAHIAIRLLSATELRVRQQIIDSRRPKRSYTMHLGDILFVYVQENRVPLSQIDARYWRVIEAGVIPVCPPNADCFFPPGAYYRVVAQHIGRSHLPLAQQRTASVQVLP